MSVALSQNCEIISLLNLFMCLGPTVHLSVGLHRTDGLHSVDVLQIFEQLRAFFPALILTKTNLPACFGNSLKTSSTWSPSIRTFIIVGSSQ